MSVDVAINIMQPMLVFIFTVIFLWRLVTRGTRKGGKLLGVSFLTITMLIAISIYNAIQWSSIPLGPPPEIWSEAYGDSLFMRRYAYETAVSQSILFLILSTLLVFRRWYDVK